MEDAGNLKTMVFFITHFYTEERRRGREKESPGGTKAWFPLVHS